MHNEESFVYFYILCTNTLSLWKDFAESSSKTTSSYCKAISTQPYEGSQVIIHHAKPYQTVETQNMTAFSML